MTARKTGMYRLGTLLVLSLLSSSAAAQSPGRDLAQVARAAHVDTIEVLPEGSFDAQVYRLSSSADMSPFVSLNVNVHYDNVSRLLGTQNRLVWTLTPGNTMFLVYQHNWLRPIDQRLQSLEGLAALKLSITQRF